MPITRALEFDQTPNRMLFEIGEQARQDEMMQRKLQQDNAEKQYQLLQQINPATLSSKFEKEVVNQSMGGLVNGVAEYLKQNPSASYVDLQNKINKDLAPIAEWSARVGTVKETIKNNVASIGADEPYDKSRLMALAIDRSLYKTDDLGRKVLKSPEEIDIEADYVSIAKEDESVIDPFKGQDNALKMVREAPLTKIDDVETIETPDGRKTTKKGTVTNLPFYLQNKDGKLAIKQDDNGYIDETVYSTFYNNPATKAWINAGAKTAMNKLGVPQSPEATEWFRRSYLTNWLEVQKKGELDKVNDLLYTPKPAGVTVNIGQTGPGVEGGRMPAFKNLLGALKAGEDPMTSTKIDNNIKNALLTIADENGVFRAANVKVTPEMIDTKIGKDGSVAIYSKATGKLIAALSEQSFDQRVNEVAGGKFVQSATVQGNPNPVGSGIPWR